MDDDEVDLQRTSGSIGRDGSARRGARNSIVIMVCTLLSRLLGIVKARAISGVFGATGIADVINFTFNIPNNFRKLFAEGALTSAYIPVFSAKLEDGAGQLEESERLLSALVTFQLLLFIPLAVVSWMFGPQIIGFLSDFSDPAQIRLSAGLLIWFMVFLATISVAAVFNGLLQCHGSFFTAAASPLLFSISVIVSVLYASRYLGAYSMALGTVVGGLLQASAAYVRLRRFGYRLRPVFNFRFPAFRSVMEGWWPVMLTSLVSVLSQQFAFYFASRLPQGSVTAFNNAIIFWQTPYGIFFTAISAVFFPMMSRNFHRGDRGALADSLRRGLEYLATFMIPSAVVLIALRTEAVASILQTGRFSVSDTLLTAEVLFWYLLGMLFVSWYGFLQRYCYSTGTYRSTLTVSVVVATIDVLLTWTMVSAGVGVRALAIANSISYFVGFVILYAMTVSRLHEFSNRRMLYTMLKICVANIPLAAACRWYVGLGFDWWVSGSTFGTLLRLSGLLLGAVAIVFVSYSLLRVEFLSVLKRRRHE